MTHHRKSWSVLLGMLLGLAVLTPARAADADTSLKLVPADAAFYTASLRNREQFEILLNSKAWAKLKSLPFVQMYWKQAEKDLTRRGGPLEMLQAFQKDPQNQELLDLLVDMGSHEIFFYGDQTVVGTADLTTKVVSAIRYGPLLAKLRGQGGDLGENDLQGAIVLKSLNDNAELLRVPDFVVGFKLTKPARAEAQIKRLETLLTALLNNQPQFKGKLQRRDVGKASFLVISVDGSMVPWDDIKLPEQQAGDLDKLKKKLTAMTLTVSLGVRDNYLLFSVGADTKHLERLGKGKVLADLPEFAPLSKHASKRITETSYVSKTLREKFGTTKKDVDNLAEMGREALQKAGLPEDLQKRIRGDLDKLMKDIKSSIPEIGALTSFSFMTETGQESFVYDWSQNLAEDASRPLTLSNHLGGSPLIAGLSRARYDPASYRKFVDWMKTFYAYVDDFALPQLDDEQKKHYDDLTKLIFPILKRLDNATGKMLLPALADGQFGMVIDAKWTSTQWIPNAPAAKKPLPMVELGFVVGVSDEALLKKGFEEFRKAANDLIAIVNNQTGGQFPQLEIPAPESKKIAGGTMYFYPIPEVPGLDKRVLPNAALSPNLLTFTLSQDHSERLLSKKPLKTECPLLEKLERPLSSFSYLDWAGIVNTATPWVDYAFENAPNLPKDEKQRAAIREQVDVVLEVLKCFRCAGTVSYLHEKAQVTHTQSVFRDLK